MAPEIIPARAKLETEAEIILAKAKPVMDPEIIPVKAKPATDPETIPIKERTAVIPVIIRARIRAAETVETAEIPAGISQAAAIPAKDSLEEEVPEAGIRKRCLRKRDGQNRRDRSN